MRVAIFAEGRSDQAVIQNILKGSLGTDRDDIQMILPEYFLDETDLHSPGINNFSNWTLLKSECETREKITTFFDFVGDEALAIIQIDTAERFEKGYDVVSPVKSKPLTDSYSSELRANVIIKMQEWLANNFIERIEFAVCIEEIDAWVLPLYEKKDSANTMTQKLFLTSL